MNFQRLRFTVAIVATLYVILSIVPRATAQVGAEYTFTDATSAYTSISGGTLAIAGNSGSIPSLFNENEVAGPFNIGFNFTFGCTVYSQFSVTSAGYLILGGSAPINQNANDLRAAPRYPIITPFWEWQHYYDNYVGAGCAAGGPTPDVGVRYLLSGVSPNRVLTVEWKTNLAGDAPYWITCGVIAMHTYQIRLYESTNAIILHYGQMVVPGNTNANSSASIGIADGPSNFMSVTPGAPASVSSTVANNSFNNRLSGLAQGTQYTFTPNKMVMAGRLGVGNEGVANPTNNDILLSNVLQSIGTQGGFTPLDIRKACASPTMPLTMTITGPQASEYTFDATGTQAWATTLSTNASITPKINFRPLGGSVRNATLTITNQLTGQSISFLLAAKGAPRIVWIGDVSQGGTSTVADGDVFLNGIQVVFGNSRIFTPLTLQNILDPGISAPPAQVTYVLNDPTGSYSISPANASLTGGATSTPQILYSATHGVGTQEATLVVTADGETRTFILRAFTAAPGGLLYVGGTKVDSTSPLLVNGISCVGEGIVSVEVTAVNTGTGDFLVHGMDAFLTETEIRQGTPPYPLLRDPSGMPIKSFDYFLSLTSGNAPRNGNAPFNGLVVPEGQSRTFYLNMIPTRPEKRYAQLFFRTNGFNINDPDVNGVATRGMVRANAFAAGIGSHLSGSSIGKRPEVVVVSSTEVRHSSTTTARISNTGDCDLRISRSELRFGAGDIQDFQLVSVLPNSSVSGDDYIIPPGRTDSIIFSFSPETYGSRRATLRLVTNDSTLGVQGVTEQGVYYWDIYGEGRIGIEARGVQLPPGVIGGPGSHGFVLVENTSGGIAEIESIAIMGGNGEIVPDASHPWPGVPTTLNPGKQLQLWVELKPSATGTPGIRTAEVVIKLKGGGEVHAQVQAYVGTRLVSVLPGSLFNGAKVRVGDLARQYVALTNVGTLPIHMNDPVLTESNLGDYRVTQLARRVLEPGQTELLEVTYTPQGTGVSSGMLSFTGDQTNGTQVVTLGGEGTTGTQIINNPNGAATTPTPGGSVNRRGGEAESTGLHLYAITPNPATNSVTIRYSVPSDGEVELGIYDMSGRLVHTIVAGIQKTGDHVETVDVSSLPSGQYYAMIIRDGVAISRPMSLVR